MILLTPIFARACVVSRPAPIEQRAAGQAEADLCFEEYSACLEVCAVDHPATDPNLPSCEEQCYQNWDLCLTDPTYSPEPSCDPDALVCELDESDVETAAAATELACEAADDSVDDGYDDSTDWSCGSSDEGSSDGGLDCSVDDSDDGDYEENEDWGEDWGERSPADADGIDAPLDLPG